MQDSLFQLEAFKAEAFDVEEAVSKLAGGDLAAAAAGTSAPAEAGKAAPLAKILGLLKTFERCGRRPCPARLCALARCT
jgi:hypothetical protein